MDETTEQTQVSGKVRIMCRLCASGKLPYTDGNPPWIAERANLRVRPSDKAEKCEGLKCRACGKIGNVSIYHPNPEDLRIEQQRRTIADKDTKIAELQKELDEVKNVKPERQGVVIDPPVKPKEKAK